MKPTTDGMLIIQGRLADAVERLRADAPRLGDAAVGARMAAFPSSGEINFRLDDPDAAIGRVLAACAAGATTSPTSIACTPPAGATR